MCKLTNPLSVNIRRKSFSNDIAQPAVLERVAFELSDGEFVSIVGPSGCGKTTLIRMILGLDESYDGEIIINGEKINGPGLDRAAVFQEPRLVPWKSVRQNIAFAVAYPASAADYEIVDRLIKLVGLEGFEDFWPKDLSGGMAQRVALARALLNKPELLVLDEPLAALDHFTRLRMQRELLRVHDLERTTTVMVTHDIDEAIFLSDRIFVLSDRPASIKQVVPVQIPYPRRHADGEFNHLRLELLNALSGVA